MQNQNNQGHEHNEDGRENNNDENANNIINIEDGKIIYNFNNDNNFSQINNNSGENGNNSSFMNLLNEISGNDSQKDKQSTTSKNPSKKSDDFFSNEIINFNNIPQNNLSGKLFILYI